MFSAELSYVRFLVHVIRGRIEVARATEDRGASAIEWAVITGIIILVAATLAGIIKAAVERHQNAITTT